MTRYIAHQFSAGLFSRDSQAGIDPLGSQFPGGGRGTLIQQAQAVPKAAICQPGQNPGRIVIQVDIFLVGNILQPGGNVLLTDAPEGKPLAPGQNGCRNFVQFRSSQNKEQMLRRLLNDLQQSIEGRDGEHVHLVNNIHPHLYLRWGIYCVVPQIPDIVHAVVGCGIDFQHVHAGTGINGLTGFAAVAGITVIRVQAVDSLGQNFGAAGFARATGAGKQVGMAHFPGNELGFQGLGHRQLAGNIIKSLRPVFAIQSLIGCQTSSSFPY